MRSRHGSNPARAFLPVTLALGLACILAFTGCSSGDEPEPTSPSGPSVIPRPTSTAELAVESPSDGDVVDVGDVPLRIALEGAELVDTASTDVRPDQGHVHILLDDELLDMTSGLRGRLPDVGPGQHVLRVEFVASDHAPFDPRVVSDVVFEAT
ncbi:MAG: hypothetical protein WD206_00620 [Actinomycetota bacterium]